MEPTKVEPILTKNYEWVKFSYDTTTGSDLWAFRYLCSCVLVDGSLETATLKAMKDIYTKWPTHRDLANAPKRELANMIRDNGVRFHGPKADYLLAIANEMIKTNGKIPNNRKDLEKLPGVARHVASVVLATVFDQNEFAVDVHVRRIAKRLGIVGEDASDLEIEEAVVKSVPAGQLGHFSRSFVDFGHDVCGATPRCTNCELASGCNQESGKKVPVSNAPVNVFKRADNVVTVKVGEKEYTVRTVNGKSKCMCTAARFNRACSHLKMAAEMA